MPSASRVDPQQLTNLRKREVCRVVAEGIAQITPTTAGLAALLRFTHPSQFQQAIDAQRLALVDASINHESRLIAIGLLRTKGGL